MKAALVQMQASADKDKNLQRILAHIERAASRGAALCAFPEFMMFYTRSSQTPRELASLAEPVTGGFVSSIAAAAKEHRIEVVGSFYEKSRRKDRVYDTCFVAGRTGRILSKYQKVHLYDALGFRESAKLAAGRRLARPVNTSLGRTGVMICYDLRFPEVSRSLAAAGSEVLVAPSAWVRGPLKEEHWITMNRARAIENGCYVIAPDQVGNIYCGRSLAVDPYGRILLDMKKRRAMGMVEVDPGIVKKTRRALPLLANRRPAAYRF
ncbi:MAG: carbon-nitrogen hydrolase family protein [Nitrosopumilus sp. H13]|nr:MAG: carbon-nitrogen hydrolase family protein [Nitrosopumilus sp. H13]